MAWGTRWSYLSSGVTTGGGIGSPMIDNSARTEKQAFDEQPDDGESAPVFSERVGDELIAAGPTDRAPYATRLRMIILLSIASWALVILAIAWITGAL